MNTANALNTDQGLAQRVRFVAGGMLIVFLASWAAAFYPFEDWLDRRGTPLGADFAMFYVAGQIVADGSSEQLYDQAEHQRRLIALFPALDPSFALPYRYPPLVAVLAAPLSRLPYPLAFAAFFLASCLAWAAAIHRLLAVVPNLTLHWRRTLCWALLGWPVALETLVGGQAAMFALLIAVYAYALIRRRRWVLAGMVLGLAAYKPNVLAWVALACLLRFPAMWLGFIPVALLALGLCWLPNGWQGISQYRELSASLATQSWDVATPPWKVHGLAPWIDQLTSLNGRLSCGVVGLALTVYLAIRRGLSRGDASLAMWFATLISLNCLLNAYTPIYDLVLLCVGLALSAEALVAGYGPAIGRHWVSIHLGLALFYFGPHVSQWIAKTTGFQPFSLLVAAGLIWQVRLVHRLSSMRQLTLARRRPGE